MTCTDFGYNIKFDWKFILIHYENNMFIVLWFIVCRQDWCITNISVYSRNIQTWFCCLTSSWIDLRAPWFEYSPFPTAKNCSNSGVVWNDVLPSTRWRSVKILSTSAVLQTPRLCTFSNLKVLKKSEHILLSNEARKQIGNGLIW